MCSGNPVTDAVATFFSFLGNPIGTIINLIAKAILAGAVAVFAGLTEAIPTMTSPEPSKAVGNQTYWLVVYLAVGSLLFAAARMAIERRGDAGRTALKGIVRVVLVSGAATSVLMAAVAVSDGFAQHLLKLGVEDNLQNVGSCSQGNGIETFALLVLAFLLLIAGILHTILMYIRLGVMIVLLGTLPLAAAASMTDWGAGWWRKHVGWLIAWVLYKPAVGLVLYAGSELLNSKDTDYGNTVNERIAGIGLMLLSAVALPALLKVVVPATAAIGTGDGMSAVGGASSSFATGAVQFAAMSGGGAGPQGASGSGGASGSTGSDRYTSSTGQGGGKGGTSEGARTKTPAGSGAGAAGAGSEAAAAMGGPAGIAILAAVAASQAAAGTISGAVEGADGEKGNNT
ncbi:hypothetical protein ACWDR3_04470 [Streptomyces sp. NPDC001002]